MIIIDESGFERIVDIEKMVHYLKNSSGPASVHRVRRVDMEKSIAKIQLPEHWSKDLHSDIVSLAIDTDEYKTVLASIVGSGLAFNKAVSIHRIQNKRLLVQYENYKELFREKYAERINEHRWLYHGTSGDCVENIWSKGFNR